MRLALLVSLAAALPAPAADPPAATPPPGAGRHIQRSMRLLATSTPDRRHTVRVLFYGQSITEQKWAAQVLAGLKHRFPHANIVSENRALAGFASQMLVKTAESDLYPFQPDLLVFHVYGAHTAYEDIVRRTRERTAADVLLQTDHVTKPADLAEETDPAKLPPRGSHWDQFMNHNWLPHVAKKYGAELCDVRAMWKQHLAATKRAPKGFLADSVHLNARGEALMAECVGSTLRYDPDLPHHDDDRVVTLPLPQPAGGRVELPVTGSRVDLVFKPGATGGPVAVNIDGKPPSGHAGCYAPTRALATPGGKWPVVAGFGWDAVPVAEEWAMRVRKDPANPKRLTFTVTGSVTGDDGAGASDAAFRSKSGRVRIAPEHWNAEYALAMAGVKPVPAEFTVRWKMVPLGRDSVPPPPAPPAGAEPAVTVAQGLPNGPHTLSLSGDVAAVAAVRVYRPPFGRAK